MDRRLAILLVFAIILPISIVGCKGKVEKAEETAETTEAVAMPDVNFVPRDQVTEPAQTVATETIPPTAAPQIEEKKATTSEDKTSRAKEIQTALSKAGFYTGSIDGKIGPKTKKAIEAFQKAKGLKADGKVGPKTWAELEKYLIQQ